MGPPPPKVHKALSAMRDMGFNVQDVKVALKKLLRLYENKWELIEEDSYQVLVEAMLANQDSEVAGDKNGDATVIDELEPWGKRVRKQDEKQPSSSMLDGAGETLGKRKQVEASDSLETPLRKRKLEPVSPLPMNVGEEEIEPALSNPSSSGMLPPQTSFIEKISSQPARSWEREDPAPLLSTHRETRSSCRVLQKSPAQDMSSISLPTKQREKWFANKNLINKQPKIEPGTEVLAENSATAPFQIKDEPLFDDSPVPIAIICPPSTNILEKEGNQSQPSEDDSSIEHISVSQARVPEFSKATEDTDNMKERGGHADAACEKGKTSELVSVQESSSSNMNVASTNMGEVKILMTCNLEQSDFHMPSLDAVFRMVEERCLKSYKFLQPDFSLMNVMKEMCQCVLELGKESSDNRKEDIVNITPALESLKRSGVHDMFNGMPACSLNGSLKLNGVVDLRPVQMDVHSEKQEANRNNKIEGSGKGKEAVAPEDSTSNSLVVAQRPEVALGDVRPPHDLSDISKGEERVRISLVNEFSNEKYPSSFYYISQNIIYQNAYVNFTLARIGDEDCCSDCYGDCLAATIPCACTRKTGGEFAYTSDNLVKDAFLNECISMSRDPQKQHYFYCKVCPLEKSKNDVLLDSCKGHLIRKFIKECWSKCGCTKQCGNRVVQRGITCNLQVFFTPEGKGWGVRTLDELPRGSFVCEYVGAVLTNRELHERSTQSTGNAKHMCPLLLDADWGSGRVLKDEEALGLDATFYGNVARFLNHRCFDANLVQIPVQVETPDHHYYRLAFFTTRKVEAYEELAWDYGIDFDERDLPVKAFKCQCGSKYCRDIKRSKTKSKSIAVRRSPPVAS